METPKQIKATIEQRDNQEATLSDVNEEKEFQAISESDDEIETKVEITGENNIPTMNESFVERSSGTDPFIDADNKNTDKIEKTCQYVMVITTPDGRTFELPVEIPNDISTPFSVSQTTEKIIRNADTFLSKDTLIKKVDIKYSRRGPRKVRKPKKKGNSGTAMNSVTT